MGMRDVTYTVMALGQMAGCRGKRYNLTEIMAEATAEIIRLNEIAGDAYEQGMRDAAQIVASLFSNKSYRSVGCTASNAILAAIPVSGKEVLHDMS